MWQTDTARLMHSIMRQKNKKHFKSKHVGLCVSTRRAQIFTAAPGPALAPSSGWASLVSAGTKVLDVRKINSAWERHRERWRQRGGVIQSFSQLINKVAGGGLYIKLSRHVAVVRLSFSVAEQRRHSQSVFRCWRRRPKAINLRDGRSRPWPWIDGRSANWPSVLTRAGTRRRVWSASARSDWRHLLTNRWTDSSTTDGCGQINVFIYILYNCARETDEVISWACISIQANW